MSAQERVTHAMRTEYELYEADDAGVSLGVLCWIFLRAACTSFGGYMAMVSAVQHALVTRTRLLRQRDILDGLALVSLLPGPLAINLVAHLGYRLRGRAGAAVAVAASMTPAFVLMLICSVAYAHWAYQPALARLLQGVMPVVIAIVLHAAWKLAQDVIKGWREAALAAAATALLLGVSGMYASLLIIAGAALFGVVTSARNMHDTSEYPQQAPAVADVMPPHEDTASVIRSSSLSRTERHVLWLTGIVGCLGLLASVQQALLLKLLGIFSGMSLLLFGGAYVFVPFMQEFVAHHGWMTSREFSDAVALAQMMPGPFIVVATFIGFKVAGLPGALVATLGIIGPSTLLVVLCSQGFERLRQSMRVTAALHAVRAAMVGMVLAAALLLTKTVEPGFMAFVIGAAALFALLRFRVEPIWLLLAGGAVGLSLY